MGKRKRDHKPNAAEQRATDAAGSPRAGAKVLTDRLRPWLLGGTCALFVARPLFPSESAATNGDGLPVVMLWIALGVFWLLGAIGRPQFRVRFGWTDAAVMLLIGWHTIAAVRAATHLSPRPALNMLWEWIALGLAFFLARQLITGKREARAAVVVMVALAVVLSAYGLYQYFYEMPMTRAMYEADPDRAMRETGLWFVAGSPEQQLFESRLYSSEPIATFALTNSLAGYLAPWLVVLAGIGVSTFDSRLLQRRIWPLVAVWVAVIYCGGPIAFCLLLTKSRSAWIATALGVLLVLLLVVWILWRELAGRFGWKLGGARVLAGSLIIAATVLLAGGALIAAAAASGGLDRQVLSEASESFGYRLQYWQSTLRMIADHPFAGCGPGNFQNAYTAYKLPTASEEVADPHNFLLEVWATAGTPAVLALLAVLGCFARASICNLQSAICNLQSPPRTHPSPLPKGEGTVDAPSYVFGGAAFGFLLAFPLGQLSEAPPGLPVVLLGLLLAAGCVALLSGWVYHGRMPTLLPAVGVAVLLVNLLAAGGIGFPSVAGTLWLLMALGLNTDRPRTLPWHVAPAGLILAITLALTCYLSAYGPVLRCHGEMQSARQEFVQGNPSAARRHLQAAAQGDPLAARPLEQLAAIAFETWRQSPSDPSFDRFERYAAMALRRAPNSARVWLNRGDWYEKAFSESGRQSDIRNAVDAYSEAVRLYPTSALYRAKLALAHEAAGERAAFRQEAKKALRLHELTPHSDKKLPDELRQQLMRNTPQP